MPFVEGQPTLAGCLSWIPLKQVVKKQLFGGRYIRLYDYFTILNYQYESGAILGRARSNTLSILEKMLTTPEGTEGQTVKVLQELAKERLDRFTKDIGKEPDTFFEFIHFKELERTIGLSLTDFYLAYGSKKLIKVLGEKLPLEEALFISIRMFGLEGIGFGSSFPELTEKMYRNVYEHPDVDIGVWAMMRSYGLDIPEKPEIIPLEEREEALLLIVAAYAAEFYPELLDPLDLRSHVKV